MTFTELKNVPTRVTARDKLTLSRLRPTQLELLGDDVDLRKLYLALGAKDFDIGGSVIDINTVRTIEGASTLTVDLVDQDRVLLRSGLLSNKLDVEIDGLFFRLKEVSKSGSHLDLTFEDREVAVLRTYNRPIKQSMATSRAYITRAQFILRMLREVKEFQIPYIIPELQVRQAIATSANRPSPTTKVINRGFGIPRTNECTVKGQPMTENQRNVANKVLDAGSSLGLVHKELVMGIMTAIQESSLTNLLPPVPGAGNYLGPNPNDNPVGVFQQIPKYWYGPPHYGASRDVTQDATSFFNALEPYVKANPNEQYYVTIERVQISGNGVAYAQWRTEAERIVTTYGVPLGPPSAANNTVSEAVQPAANGDYEFYRGRPPVTNKRGWGRESTWDCIQRLAQEVQYRAFFVSGTFYYISDADLYKSEPIATIDEDTKGIISIDGDYLENTKSASLTVTCNAKRWTAPPGTVIQIRNMGPWDGRWLVNDISRSLFSPQASITLKKRLPVLPEPGGSNVSKSGSAGQTWTGTPSKKPGRGDVSYKPSGPLKIIQPVPDGFNTRLVQGYHQTSGLAGYPAADFGSNAGAPVIAVETGYIVRFSGHNPALGPNFGGIDGNSYDPHGPFAWSVYLLGDSGTEYYYTHMGTRTIPDPASVPAGKIRVNLGDTIGSVANYDLYGTPSHIHLGVHPGSTEHPDIYDIMATKKAVAVT